VWLAVVLKTLAQPMLAYALGRHPVGSTVKDTDDGVLNTVLVFSPTVF